MKRALAVLACVGCVAACTALQPPPAEPESIFVLEDRSDGDSPHPKTGPVIEVTLPRARAGFDTDQMVYTRRTDQIEYFSRNRWADTPARMLAPALAHAIERSGAFRAVVRDPNAVHTDLRLDTELVRLQQNFNTHPSRIEIEVRVLLAGSTPPDTLAMARFEESEEATSDDPYAGVEAANRALSRLVRRVAEFCVNQVSPH